MRTDIAQALCKYHPDLNVADVMDSLQKIRPQKMNREGLRMRPVQEMYGILSIALKMRIESENAQWPTREALAHRTRMLFADLQRVLLRMPDEIGKRFVRPIPKGHAGAKIARVKRS
jgi:hypothetical protein